MKTTIVRGSSCNICMKRKCRLRPSRNCKQFVPPYVKPITTLGVELLDRGYSAAQFGLNESQIREVDNKNKKEGRYI